jgi:hypothetical protein
MIANRTKETSVGLLLLICDFYWLLVGNATPEYLVIVMLLNMSIKFAIFQENEESIIDWIVETSEYCGFRAKRNNLKQRILVTILASSICYLKMSVLIKVMWFVFIFYAKQILEGMSNNDLFRIAFDFFSCLVPSIWLYSEPMALILVLLALKTISSYPIIPKTILILAIACSFLLGKVNLQFLGYALVWVLADMSLSVLESQALMLFSLILVDSIISHSIFDFANYLLIYGIFYVSFVFDMRSSLDYYISFFAKLAYCGAILITLRHPPLLNSIERQLAYITVSLFIKESKTYFAYFAKLSLIDDPVVTMSMVRIANFFKFFLSVTLSMFYYSKFYVVIFLLILTTYSKLQTSRVWACLFVISVYHSAMNFLHIDVLKLIYDKKYHLFAKIKVKIFSLPFWQIKIKSFDNFAEWLKYSKLGVIFTFLQIVLFAITLLTMNERDYKIVREISVD